MQFLNLKWVDTNNVSQETDVPTKTTFENVIDSIYSEFSASHNSGYLEIDRSIINLGEINYEYFINGENSIDLVIDRITPIQQTILPSGQNIVTNAQFPTELQASLVKYIKKFNYDESILSVPITLYNTDSNYTTINTKILQFSLSGSMGSEQINISVIGPDLSSSSYTSTFKLCYPIHIGTIPTYVKR